MSGLGTSDDALREINQQIRGYRQSLEKKLAQIPKIKQNNDFDLFKFAIIGFVCIFFAIVVIDNSLKTLRLYWRAKKLEKMKMRQVTTPDENEYQNESSTDFQYQSELRRNVRRAGERQNKALHGAKQEKIAAQGKEYTKHDIERAQLEGAITLESVDKSNDEYSYEKEKSKSFWDMLFVKNDYEKLS